MSTATAYYSGQRIAVDGAGRPALKTRTSRQPITNPEVRQAARELTALCAARVMRLTADGRLLVRHGGRFVQLGQLASPLSLR